MRVKQDEVRRYKAFRESVLDAREEDKKDRNQTKERQLQQCIDLQVGSSRQTKRDCKFQMVNDRVLRKTPGPNFIKL